MNIPPDKLLHLKLGALLALLLAALAWIALAFGPGYSVAVGSVALGLGVEAYQQVRGEGKWELKDAAFTAFTGVAGGLIFEAWRAFGERLVG